MPLTFAATCGRNVNESKDFGLDVFPGRFEDTGKTMQLLRGREGDVSSRFNKLAHTRRVYVIMCVQ